MTTLEQPRTFEPAMKGIVLAGGAGTRLHPVTTVISKQLLPVYDKPMVYYPLSMLMLGGIRDVLVISTPRDLPSFRHLLGDGARFGIHISYAAQERPSGLADAFVIGASFVAESPVCLVLGDNIFYGNDLGEIMRRGTSLTKGARILAYRVKDPGRYGIVHFDAAGHALGLDEKPAAPKSNFAVPGLYFYDATVVARAAVLAPSERGELEITDLNRTYLISGQLQVEQLGRGIAWFDTGTQRSLLDAANFVAAIEDRQGLKIACLEEIALRNGWIDAADVRSHLSSMGKGSYADYLSEMLLSNEG